MTHPFPDKPATELSSTKAIFQVFIRGPIEKVWHEISKTDEVQLAMFNCRMHNAGGLNPGAPFSMRTKDGKCTAVVGKILECTPPTRLSYTFKFTMQDDPECVVTYDLEEAEGGTNFTLTVDDMPEGTKTAKSMSTGGLMILNTLKRVVETGNASFVTRAMYFVYALMGPLTPKVARTENWREFD